jgi:hypothetical protein
MPWYAYIGQRLPDADCDACEDECRWFFDARCQARRNYCRALAGASNLSFGAVTAYCNRHTVEGNGRIQRATDLLVERGLFEREFVDGIVVTVCEGYSRLVRRLVDMESVALSSDDLIWVDSEYASASSDEVFNPYMAHLYFHSHQWRSMGISRFGCEYSQLVLRGGDNTPTGGTGNYLEEEAWECEDNVTECINLNTNCPT